MANRRIEEQLEALSRLRGASPADAAPALRKALADRVNLVAAKAANIAASLPAPEILPDLLRAFDRLFEDPVKRDPQCWGKTTRGFCDAAAQEICRDSSRKRRGFRKAIGDQLSERAPAGRAGGASARTCSGSPGGTGSVSGSSSGPTSAAVSGSGSGPGTGSTGTRLGRRSR